MIGVEVETNTYMTTTTGIKIENKTAGEGEGETERETEAGTCVTATILVMVEAATTTPTILTMGTTTAIVMAPETDMRKDMITGQARETRVDPQESEMAAAAGMGLIRSTTTSVATVGTTQLDEMIAPNLTQAEMVVEMAIEMVVVVVEAVAKMAMLVTDVMKKETVIMIEITSQCMTDLSDQTKNTAQAEVGMTSLMTAKAMPATIGGRTPTTIAEESTSMVAATTTIEETDIETAMVKEGATLPATPKDTDTETVAAVKAEGGLVQ